MMQNNACFQNEKMVQNPPDERENSDNTVTQERKTFSFLKSGLLFLALLAVTFFVVFKNLEARQLFQSMRLANGWYLLAGCVAMCLFSLGEAANIYNGFSIMKTPVSFWLCIKYAVAGFFFSSITPSASGGQPMQVYYMHKDHIPVAKGSLALLLELISYQIATIGIALVGIFLKWDFLSSQTGSLKYLFAAGLLLNLLLLLLIAIAVFSKKLIHSLMRFVVKVVSFVQRKDGAEFYQKAERMVEEYQQSAVYIRKNKRKMGRMLLVSFLQIAALHSVVFWVYRSFGFYEYGFLDVVLLQAVLFITVSALPLPGTVGVGESGFLLLYKTLFPGAYLGSGMLLSRGINLYLYVIVTGLFLLLYCVVQKRRCVVE